MLVPLFRGIKLDAAMERDVHGKISDEGIWVNSSSAASASRLLAGETGTWCVSVVADDDDDDDTSGVVLFSEPAAMFYLSGLCTPDCLVAFPDARSIAIIGPCLLLEYDFCNPCCRTPIESTLGHLRFSSASRKILGASSLDRIWSHLLQSSSERIGSNDLALMSCFTSVRGRTVESPIPLRTIFACAAPCCPNAVSSSLSLNANTSATWVFPVFSTIFDPNFPPSDGMLRISKDRMRKGTADLDTQVWQFGFLLPLDIFAISLLWAIPALKVYPSLEWTWDRILFATIAPARSRASDAEGMGRMWPNCRASSRLQPWR